MIKIVVSALIQQIKQMQQLNCARNTKANSTNMEKIA